VFIAFLLFLSACAANDDAARFAHEYEVLNGRTTPDGEHVYKRVDIPPKNKFVYTDGKNAVNLLASGSGVLYMGFPECPWCRTLLPVLIAAIDESGYKGNVYYYNGLDDRDALSLSGDGAIVIEEKGEQAYHDLVNMLYDYLTPYKGLDDESIKRIYFPTTVFFKDGTIVSVHLVTLDSQESGYDELTELQYQELKSALCVKLNEIL
jgi:thiol-disulfide isomerase/thioredoxin